MLAFGRGVFRFIFNFHPTQSFTDYPIPAAVGASSTSWTAMSPASADTGDIAAGQEYFSGTRGTDFHLPAIADGDGSQTTKDRDSAPIIFEPFRTKMEAAGLSAAAVAAFERAYGFLPLGRITLIPEDEIDPITDMPNYGAISMTGDAASCWRERS